jgi:hypothetical protein
VAIDDSGSLARLILQQMANAVIRADMILALVKYAAGVKHGAVAVARDVTARVEEQRATAHFQNTASA